MRIYIVIVIIMIGLCFGQVPVGDQLRTADVGGWIALAIAAYAVIFLLRSKKTDTSPQPPKPPAAPGGGNAAQERQ
jgi:hypothetical protein